MRHVRQGQTGKANVKLSTTLARLLSLINSPHPMGASCRDWSPWVHETKQLWLETLWDRKHSQPKTENVRRGNKPLARAA